MEIWIIEVLLYYGILANLVHLNKLYWYLLLTKGIIAVLWKKENEVTVSLLIILHAMTLYNDLCTRMRSH